MQTSLIERRVSLCNTWADDCCRVFTERFRLPPGPVRSISAHHRLLTARSAVVRGRHGPIRHARAQSYQILGRQCSRRTTRDARSQVLLLPCSRTGPTAIIILSHADRLGTITWKGQKPVRLISQRISSKLGSKWQFKLDGPFFRWQYHMWQIFPCH